MHVFWFIPTHGDSRYLGTSEGARAVHYDYLRQVATAADTLGYEGVLIPTGRSCERPLGGRLGTRARDTAPEVPRGGAPGPAPAGPGRSHGRDLRPPVGRAPAHQPRDGRRPHGTGGRRCLPGPCPALCTVGGIHPYLARDPVAQPRGRHLRLRGRAPVGEGRQAALPAGAEALSAGVLRRLVRGRARPRGGAGRYLPHLGRAAGRGWRRRWPTCAPAPRNGAGRCASAYGCT